MIPKLLAIVAAVVLGVLVDLWAGADLPGFGAGIGLAGTLILTFGSKGLAVLAKRPPDYYEHEDLPRPEGPEAADG